MVSPQSALQADQSTIHLILTTAAIPNWVPVLFSVYAHIGGMRQQRIEVHARTLPPTATYEDYIHLLGYGEFVHTLAAGSYISLGRNRFEGLGTLMTLQVGGNYALHISLQSLPQLITNMARVLVETRQANSSTVTSEDDDASMMQLGVPSTFPQDRLFDKHDPADLALEEFIYPLPNTVGEAIGHPRTIRLFPGWGEFCRLLTAHGPEVEMPLSLHIYAIRGHHVGERSTQVQSSNQLAILQAVQQTWGDYIEDYSFLIHVLTPQPSELPRDSLGLLL